MAKKAIVRNGQEHNFVALRLNATVNRNRQGAIAFSEKAMASHNIPLLVV